MLQICLILCAKNEHEQADGRAVAYVLARENLIAELTPWRLGSIFHYWWGLHFLSSGYLTLDIEFCIHFQLVYMIAGLSRVQEDKPNTDHYRGTEQEVSKAELADEYVESRKKRTMAKIIEKSKTRGIKKAAGWKEKKTENMNEKKAETLNTRTSSDRPTRNKQQDVKNMQWKTFEKLLGAWYQKARRQRLWICWQECFLFFSLQYAIDIVSKLKFWPR